MSEQRRCEEIKGLSSLLGGVVMPETLSKYFRSVASKRLSEGETDPKVSNQHELNGVNALRRMLGDGRRSFDGVRFIYLGETLEESLSVLGAMTWYDAREKHEVRTEYRFYYEANEVMGRAQGGDLLVMGLRPSEELVVVIARARTPSEEQLSWLFGVTEESGSYTVQTETKTRELRFIERYILSHMGVNTAESLSEDRLPEMLEKFGHQFPTTHGFSLYARETLDHISLDPDHAIIQCIQREEALFRSLEEHLVMQRLKEGFSAVCEFENFAKSWINRRYSRAGHAFENHLSFLFEREKLHFSKGQITEGAKKPDFVFPSVSAYQFLPGDVVGKLVTLLGAKTSCKDRWRQVISEGARLKDKHLVTLQPRISISQTDEMKASNVTLIVPDEIQETYSSVQLPDLMNLKSFIELVSMRQNHSWTAYAPHVPLLEMVKEGRKKKRTY